MSIFELKVLKTGKKLVDFPTCCEMLLFDETLKRRLLKDSAKIERNRNRERKSEFYSECSQDVLAGEFPRVYKFKTKTL